MNNYNEKFGCIEVNGRNVNIDNLNIDELKKISFYLGKEANNLVSEQNELLSSLMKLRKKLE